MTEVLENIDSETRRKIFAEFGKTDEDVAKDREIVSEWLKTQAHLPETPARNMIDLFLIFNKFSVEITKQKLDMYYTVRSVFPDFFDNIHPNSAVMRNNYNSSNIIVLPKLTEDFSRCFVYTFEDVPTDEHFVEALVGKTLNVQEVRIHEDLSAHQYVIIDFKNLKLENALKFTPSNVKITTTLLEKVYSNRLKQIHFLNFHPAVNILMKLAKLFMKPKLIDRIKIHESPDTLKNYIPSRILPSDFGGEEKSISELNDMWREKLEEYQSRFDLLAKMRVNENKRPVPLESLDEVDRLGMQGTFKKLDID
ncbi:unnamed protein product [Phyllotreta striolata]|uniref:CRAL-TRIO domain-containing protein n=1 Tax=Phyllotreta striolata TaxID=444603 RepID=A0A9N9TJ17_PHYSR|nr:unnamed protein product [Phyllotreta striolata]